MSLIRNITSFFVVTCFLTNSYGQLCTGVLGPPTVNVTFGTPTDPNTGGFNPPTAYTYIADNCPNDGYYTITSATSGCFWDHWHTISSDHTGGGNFMLVNATYVPGDFFVGTVNGLCPNTTYEFASWVMNVLNVPGINPNVTFTIEQQDGTLIAQYSTGDIPRTANPEWKQYGLYFTTPPATGVVVLRITNNAPGGDGNDLALDDITFRPCGPIIVANIQGSKDTIDICEESRSPFSFAAASPPEFISPVFQWQQSIDSGLTWTDIPGATATLYNRQPTAAGSFWYRMAVSELSAGTSVTCRTSSSSLVVNVRPRPIVNAGPDQVILKGDSAQLGIDNHSPNVSYNWWPNHNLTAADILQPKAYPTNETEYNLTAVSEYGCTNSDKAVVKVIQGLYIPTGFTPNNDGINDTWQIPYLDLRWEPVVTVYNRWGQIIYSANNKPVNWDGRFNGQLQPIGTYIYYIHFRNGNHSALKGTFTLIK